mmetsp:Transcript_15385/g.22856  ORF Transcript_15385/g.22856 Transcript_15385/m.22856 type:complete len:324 (+) Transcript_15385:75-1046(+)|eukprot:CAMPEP_0171461724 /NCGR_PEP_ID=MMETSP0945-20130129/6054_1 /TAXON_ID=109269 /ORGANISM="Vaucheria litorea, Strain CCMP2940" /LENGTH=323 /DNA_ID=CAMNT_0011988121 /DNA_START=36 /DNA_END=1007 /DNA_ORIENTATION=-
MKYFVACALLACRTFSFLPANTFQASRILSSTANLQLLLHRVDFDKYEGLGNDFILIDNRHSQSPILTPEQSSKLCSRNYGVGADGVIFALQSPSVDYDYTMKIYNSDGSEPEMCGNGIRCMAKFIAKLEGKDVAQYKVRTNAGLIVPVIDAQGLVTVDMGRPELRAEKIPTNLIPNTNEGALVSNPLEIDGVSYDVTCVSMGNPHCVVFVDNLDQIDLHKIGPKFEHHPSFPARINTEFVKVLQKDHLVMKVWERGAGPTLACGTGACALVVAAVLNDLSDRKCKVTLPGGDLTIEWRESDDKVYMTGPAKLVFSGSYEIQG